MCYFIENIAFIYFSLFFLFRYEIHNTATYLQFKIDVYRTCCNMNIAE